MLTILKHLISFHMVSRICLGLTVVIVHLVVDVFYAILSKCGAGSLIVRCSAGPLMQDHVELVDLPVFAMLQSRFKNRDSCVLR